MTKILLALLFVMLSALSRADSWAAPTARIFSSANGKFLLHVSPKGLKSFPELPEDAAENAKERKALGLHQACYATLFRKDEEKWIGSSAVGFRPVWTQKLVNETAPMDAFVSDDGRYVVTTNDYGILGDGDNVVVIYNSEGTLVRNFKLSELIPEADIPRIPQSVSSVYWSGTHRIDSKNGLLLLQVWQSGSPMNELPKQPMKYRTVKVRLSNGEIMKESRRK